MADAITWLLTIIAVAIGIIIVFFALIIILFLLGVMMYHIHEEIMFKEYE